MFQDIMELNQINSFLDEIYTWVLKSKEGLTKDEARRIFQRYRSVPKKDSDEQPPDSPDNGEQPQNSHQERQMAQILNYMTETTTRLNQIEDDIGYIKARVDSILKKL